MALQTRGSDAIDKAQRRLASLKSIDGNLDLGHGFTIGAYAQMIEKVRSAIEAHNTLVSAIDESRRNVTALEKELADFSARMLSGVSTRYGRNSNEYRKAGGSLRKSKAMAAQSNHPPVPKLPQPAVLENVVATNGTVKNKAQTV